jgi:hypothetical protein
MTLPVNLRQSTGCKHTASGYLLLQPILYFESTRFITRPVHPLCSSVTAGLAIINQGSNTRLTKMPSLTNSSSQALVKFLTNLTSRLALELTSLKFNEHQRPLLWAQTGQGVRLTTHLPIMPTSRTCTSTPTHVFKACTRDEFILLPRTWLSNYSAYVVCLKSSVNRTRKQTN